MLPPTVYVGFDSRKPGTAHVCAHSIRRRSKDVGVEFIDAEIMRRRALYWRQSETTEEGVLIDKSDRKPFSTEFSFTRFLTPFLHHREGWAAFCDDDFLWLEDANKLFELADPKYAVMVVKHAHLPTEAVKMDGRPQTVYPRKNWSSLVLWNCEHPANRQLTSQDINTKPGAWLHGFRWLNDCEIGSLPEEWNFLVGVSPTTGNVMRSIKALHYTLGGPWFESWRDRDMSALWLAEKESLDAVTQVATAEEAVA
jgi:hypothetical protein